MVLSFLSYGDVYSHRLKATLKYSSKVMPPLQNISLP